MSNPLGPASSRWFANWNRTAKSIWAKPKILHAMNCWSEKIQISQPLQNVLVKSDTADEDNFSPEQLRLSYERGRRDGENALNEQLLKQRTEIQGLMHGALNALSHAVPQVIRDTE